MLRRWYIASGLFLCQNIVMAYVEFNPNPTGRRVGDCSVRAVAAALDISWEEAFALMAINAYQMGDVISADSVWGSVLRQHGFYRSYLLNDCPDCYTAGEFAEDHPEGIYVLGFGGHVATIKNGELMDAWDSSKEIPQFVWYKED